MVVLTSGCYNLRLDCNVISRETREYILYYMIQYYIEDKSDLTSKQDILVNI